MADDWWGQHVSSTSLLLACSLSMRFTLKGPGTPCSVSERPHEALGPRPHLGELIVNHANPNSTSQLPYRTHTFGHIFTSWSTHAARAGPEEPQHTSTHTSCSAPPPNSGSPGE